MKRKQPYKTPLILREVRLQLEGELLTGSVADNIEVTSMGQEVRNYDYDFNGNTDGFNHNWE
jgi:hypothetical protein